MTNTEYESEAKLFLGGKRTTGFAAIAAVLLILLCLVFLVFRSNNDDQSRASAVPSAPSTPQINTAPAPAVAPPADEETANQPLTQAPETTWALVGKVALPTVPGVGPATVDGLIATGYQHSSTGALLAAANAFYRFVYAGDEIWEQMTDAMMAPGPGQDAWRKLRGGVKTGDTDLTAEYTQITGFQFLSYTPTESVIQLVTVDNNGSLQVTAVRMDWADSDWKLAVTRAGKLTENVQTIRTLKGFIAWNGVG